MQIRDLQSPDVSEYRFPVGMNSTDVSVLTRADAILQAHDWQAYQELLAKQKGPEGASEKYEVINRFLDDTEDYLHKLAGKVASVKLSQEASEAAAQAMAEARAQVCYCLLATVIHLVP